MNRARHAARCLTLALALGAAGLLHAQITTRSDAAGKMLNEWAAQGTAAGLTGIAYENRDSGHSLFDYQAYPQLKLHTASAEEKMRKLDIANANAIRLNPTFGNSSMASPASLGGSLPRFYYLNRSGLAFLYTEYASNNLFFYPAHQDYRDGSNGRGGWGDLYPANTPYLVISQGSSYLDKPFLRAFVSTTAAFKPDVQAVLLKDKLLMLTLQAIFRRSNSQVRTEDDYFTGKAHPPVFEGTQIDEVKMVQAAHAMTVSDIPPMAALEVVKEGIAQGGQHFFEADKGTNESLADTPCAIARIFRGSPWAREMLVSTRKSVDVQRRLLTFRWALLQGDPRRVKIEPQPDGVTAKITIAWHPEMRRAESIGTHRVEIGVFATNGVAWSPPSFITFYMLPNEARFYDARERLEEICYEAGNPDIGIPPLRDLRWLSLGRRLTSPDEKSMGIKLLRQVLPKLSIEQSRGIADELAPMQQAWRALSRDEKKKSEAEAAQNELEALIEQKLTHTFAGTAQPPLHEMVSAAISTIADAVDLYVALQEVVRADAKTSPKPNAADELETARQKVVDYLIYNEVTPTQVALRFNPDQLTAGERYQLRQFHLTVLNLALLPEFLDRVEKPAFVDPRLTTPKPWRDVHRYNKNGEWAGWTRITGGHEYEFDARGNLFPEGRNGRAVPVKYVKDASGTRLLFMRE